MITTLNWLPKSRAVALVVLLTIQSDASIALADDKLGLSVNSMPLSVFAAAVAEGMSVSIEVDESVANFTIDGQFNGSLESLLKDLHERYGISHSVTGENYTLWRDTSFSSKAQYRFQLSEMNIVTFLRYLSEVTGYQLIADDSIDTTVSGAFNGTLRDIINALSNEYPVLFYINENAISVVPESSFVKKVVVIANNDYSSEAFLTDLRTKLPPGNFVNRQENQFVVGGHPDFVEKTALNIEIDMSTSAGKTLNLSAAKYPVIIDIADDPFAAITDFRLPEVSLSEISPPAISPPAISPPAISPPAISPPAISMISPPLAFDKQLDFESVKSADDVSDLPAKIAVDTVDQASEKPALSAVKMLDQTDETPELSAAETLDKASETPELSAVETLNQADETPVLSAVETVEQTDEPLKQTVAETQKVIETPEKLNEANADAALQQDKATVVRDQAVAQTPEPQDEIVGKTQSETTKGAIPQVEEVPESTNGSLAAATTRHNEVPETANNSDQMNSAEQLEAADVEPVVQEIDHIETPVQTMKSVEPTEVNATQEKEPPTQATKREEKPKPDVEVKAVPKQNGVVESVDQIPGFY